MNGGSRLAWVPAFAVGASAAIALEVAMALLLYTGPGLVRSLTAVLAVGAVTFAAGLWSASDSGTDLVERLRRRWLFCLFAYLAAAVLGVAWSLPGLWPQGRPFQALALAGLAALPLFAAGSALGSVGSVARRPTALLASAALGAGVGFLLTGALLPRTPLPSSLLLVCLVLLSVGGMVLGSILDDVIDVEVREELGSGPGAVRVEISRPVEGEAPAATLLEAGHVRRRAGQDDRSAPWDVAVARALLTAGPREPSVLLVGGGASLVPATLLAEGSEAFVHVLERSPEVVELSRRYFGFDVPEGQGVVEVGNLEDTLKAIRRRYDVVLVDADALGPLGGAGGLSREARARIAQAVAPTGAMVWGPRDPGTHLPETVAGWPTVSLARDTGSATEIVTVTGPGGLPDLTALGGFELHENGAER